MIAVLAAGGFLGTLLSIFFIIICILLIFMVVITPSQEGGMAAAFGGMGSDSFFGTKAHQHSNKFTVFLAVGSNWTNKVVIAAATPGTGKSSTEEKMKNLPPSKNAPELPPIPPPPN